MIRGFKDNCLNSKRVQYIIWHPWEETFFTKLYAHNLNSMAIKHFNGVFLKGGLRGYIRDKRINILVFDISHVYYILQSLEFSFSLDLQTFTKFSHKRFDNFGFFCFQNNIMLFDCFGIIHLWTKSLKTRYKCSVHSASGQSSFLVMNLNEIDLIIFLSILMHFLSLSHEIIPRNNINCKTTLVTQSNI